MRNVLANHVQNMLWPRSRQVNESWGVGGVSERWWQKSRLQSSSERSKEAKDHVGEHATVCGKLACTRWAESSYGSPAFLNFDQPYPDQIFTVVIWGTDRSKFGEPETTYRGKRICVTGKISAFKGVPEVVATEPSQIKAQ
jgi:hypothetical protein